MQKNAKNLAERDIFSLVCKILPSLFLAVDDNKNNGDKLEKLKSLFIQTTYVPLCYCLMKQKSCQYVPVLV